MADRFYAPEVLAPGEFTLTGADAHHLSTVRRFEPGDRVTLFNGDGCDYPAEVVVIGKKSAVLNVLPPIVVDRELGYELTIASALPKGDRGDFLIEKLTELGVTRFVPLLCTRSVVVPKANVVDKLTRGVIEASKQCGRNRLMRVDQAQKWDAFVSRTDLPAVKIVLHTSSGGTTCDANQDVVIAIGPEGGFTDSEIENASGAGWQVVSLGPRILRIETAAIAAAVHFASR